MDMYQVPKKINRHVLKALNFLRSQKGNGAVTTSEIIAQVQHQMRNLVPVPNIEMMIPKSIKNLSDIGLIDRTEFEGYSLVGGPPISKEPSTKRHLFKPTISRKRTASNLDPNSRQRPQYDSLDSMSGNEYDRSRKRLRTNNKKIVHTGRKTELPKSRHHKKNSTLRKTLAEEAAGNIENNLGAWGDDNWNLVLPHFTPRYAMMEVVHRDTNNVFVQHPPIESPSEVSALYNNTENFNNDSDSLTIDTANNSLKSVLTNQASVDSKRSSQGGESETLVLTKQNQEESS